MTLDAFLGVQRTEISPDRVVAEWTIGPNALQRLGIPHGGAYCVVHESTGSLGGFTWLNRDAPEGEPVGVVVGTNNTTDFLRQAAEGDVITTTATPIFRGRTQQLWRVESVNQDGKLIAQGQMRLANLPAIRTP